jgi:uncharacterized protein YcbX
MINVTSLHVYPIKSCAGISLDRADIGPRGIRHDREWLVVKLDSGEFLTQREQPRLALIRPALVENGLTLFAPGLPSLEVPIVGNGAGRRVRVWEDWCDAIDQGDHAARWLSEHLSTECRLVRMDDGFVRKVDPDYAVDDWDQVGFADSYPLLLISEESLSDLNARLTNPLPMNRFRPNVVIGGAREPFSEDRLRVLRIGDVVFYAVKPCSRCVTTTTDQLTAERGHEPLTTLATFRKVGSKVLFGQNLIHANPGEIRVGDEVTVVEWR